MAIYTYDEILQFCNREKVKSLTLRNFCGYECSDCGVSTNFFMIHPNDPIYAVWCKVCDNGHYNLEYKELYKNPDKGITKVEAESLIIILTLRG